MKPIGPYVAVHELPTPPPGVAAAKSLIQTLRATDRLTGIPVLLHLLPQAQSLPQLPLSPHLLAVVDSGVDGEQAYVVTELPLHASEARDPLLAARGALAGLAALHEAGLAHGGVSEAQLWNLGSAVVLAGAGLPWRENATSQGDLNDLAATLQDLGALPAALLPLRDQPGTLTARGALALLGSGVGSGGAAQGAGKRPQALPQAPASADSRTPSPLPPPDGPALAVPAPTPAPARGPTGHSETPQERRKRQTAERQQQAGADGQPAALRRAGRLNAQKTEQAQEGAQADQHAAQPLPVPEPFQMGFADETEQASAAVGAHAAPGPRQVERLPASLRRPVGKEPSGAVSRLPSAAPAAQRRGSAAAKRDLPPIRIGWDEDDSWRVVRSAPVPRTELPRWWWAVLGTVVLGAVVIWAAFRPVAAPAPATALPCCTVSFALRGVAGITAQLSVDSAPATARLRVGEVLGRAPGKIDFPVEGRYRLRVAAAGYQPATLEVSVPRQQPVNIDLGN